VAALSGRSPTRFSTSPASLHRQHRQGYSRIMKVIYDPDKDILQITFVDTTVEETTQIAPGLVIDYDVDGNTIGLEITKASTKVDNPYAMCYIVGAGNFDKPRLNEKD
jgi:uncharacterized protein YuzE